MESSAALPRACPVSSQHGWARPTWRPPSFSQRCQTSSPTCLSWLIGGFVASHRKQQFFPEDVQYWFYLDIWLPNDVPLTATNDAAVKAEQVVRQVVEGSAKTVSKEESGKHLLTSVTSFIGGGGPRFWFSISP